MPKSRKFKPCDPKCPHCHSILMSVTQGVDPKLAAERAAHLLLIGGTPWQELYLLLEQGVDALIKAARDLMRLLGGPDPMPSPYVPAAAGRIC